MSSDLVNRTRDVSWQEALISSIDIGIIVIDREYRIEEWNQFMQNHTGIDVEDTQNRSLFDCLPELEDVWFRKKCQPVFELRTPVFIIWEQREYLVKMQVARPVTSLAEHMYQNISIMPILDCAGEVNKACIIIYDVTDQAINKLQIVGLNEQLEEISRTDGLTGLFNRRYWQERFELEYKLTFRTRKPISVIILDIDHFKSVNDTYGHQAGDTVIKKIAEIVKNATRETDVAGRYGGEEFVIILPDTTAENAKIVAERIRVKAENSIIQHDMTDISVTVSLGIAEFDDEFSTAMQWLEGADKALYEAKSSGRNQSVIANR